MDKQEVKEMKTVGYIYNGVEGISIKSIGYELEMYVYLEYMGKIHKLKVYDNSKGSYIEFLGRRMYSTEWVRI